LNDDDSITTTESRRRNDDDDTIDRVRDDFDEDTEVQVSTLNLVDLAGSESVRLIGATGERQKEGGNINKRFVFQLTT
jgi:centromeric protein E